MKWYSNFYLHFRRLKPQFIKSVVLCCILIQFTETYAQDTSWNESTHTISRIVIKSKDKLKIWQYDQNGNRQSYSEFENNQLHGVQQGWNEDGSDKYLMHYKRGLLTGTFKQFSPKGILIQKQKYKIINSVNGPVSVFTGSGKIYSEEGILLQLTQYKNGVKHGKEFRWNSKGEKEEAAFYSNGNITGRHYSWYPGGMKQSEEWIRKGNRYSRFVRYSPSGSIVFDYRVKWAGKNGSKVEIYDGKYIYNFEDGTPKRTCYYKNGLLHGPYIEYTYSGNILSARSYINGNPVGKAYFYYQNGMLERVESYILKNVNGKDTSFKDGEEIMYSISGTKVESVMYKEGVKTGFYYLYGPGSSVRTQTEFHNNKPYCQRDFYSNGKLMQETLFYRDYSTGSELTGFSHFMLDTSGHIIQFQDTVNGLPAGYYFALSSEGIMQTEGYRFGKCYKGGNWVKIYYPNGKLRSENVQVSDYNRNEFLVEWYPDGKLKKFFAGGCYLLVWTSSGRLFSSAFYKDNNPNLVIDTAVSAAWTDSIYTAFSHPETKALTFNPDHETLSPVKSYYTKTSVRFESYLKGNHFDSLFIMYYPNGTRMIEWQLKDGLLNGRVTRYHGNGKVSEYYTYRNGIWNYEQGHFDADGLPESVCTIDQIISGDIYYTQTQYYPGTAIVKSINKLKNNREFGEQKNFFPSGNIQSIWNSNGNFPVGESRSYFDSGGAESIVHFDSSGYRSGKATYFYPSGKRSKEYTYKAGIANGKFTSWFANGQVEMEGWMKNNLQEGDWKIFDSLGNSQESTTYEMGVPKRLPLERISYNCGCYYPVSTSRGFLQSLSSYMETFTPDYVFPYLTMPANFENELYVSDFNTDGWESGSGSQMYYLDLIAFHPVLINLPKSPGIDLWLNPCFVKREESHVRFSLNLRKGVPSETVIRMDDGKYALRFLKSPLSPVKPDTNGIRALFYATDLEFGMDRMKMSGVDSFCVSPAFIAGSDIQVNIQSFVPVVSGSEDAFSINGYYVDEINEIPQFYRVSRAAVSRDTFSGLASGKAIISWNTGNGLCSARAENLLLTSEHFSGEMQLKVSQLVENGFEIQLNNGKTWLVSTSQLKNFLISKGLNFVSIFYAKDTATLNIHFVKEIL